MHCLLFFRFCAKDFYKDDMLQSHEKDIQNICLDIQKVDEKLDAFIKAYKIQLRHSIVRSCEEALRDGEISGYALQSIDDLYEVYSVDLIKGDTYATTLVRKVHKDVAIKFSEESE